MANLEEAQESACHIPMSGICIPNPNTLALIVFEISTFIRTDRGDHSDYTDRQTDRHG